MSTNVLKNTKGIPSWFNAQEIVESAKETQDKVSNQVPLRKEASNKIVILSYRDSRGHVVPSSDPMIVSQLVRKEGPFDQWGQLMIPHKQINVSGRTDIDSIQSVSDLKQIDPRERQLHPSYMTDSTINRHLQYKALQKLTDFANSMGMYGARARFLHAKNASMEGKQFQGFREITAEISYLVGPRLKKNVTATIGIDVGNKFVLPKVFTSADGNQHEFTKDAVADLLKGMQFEKPTRDVRKRSDIPIYKKPDPTQFMAIPKS